MADNRPWSVKGIDPETRATAKAAARRAGLTLGAWLGRTVRAQAAQELMPARHGASDRGMADPTGDPAADAGIAPTPDRDGLGEAIAPVARRLDDLARQFQGFKNRSAESVTLVEQALISLNERLRKLERGDAAGGTRDSRTDESNLAPSSPNDQDARAGRISRLFNRED